MDFSPTSSGESVADGRDSHTRARQLRAMARQLWLMAQSYDDHALSLVEGPWAGQQKRTADAALTQAQLRALAADAFQHRRHRDRLFDADLFGEPAWDMLLDLFVRTIDGHVTRTTEMTFASAVPPTTSLRWISQLNTAGLIERQDCADDRRAHFLVLTPKGMNLMIRCLTAVANGPEADLFPPGSRDGSEVAPSPGSSGLSDRLIAAGFPRLGKMGRRLLSRLLQSPGRPFATVDLIAALGGSNRFSKVHVERGLEQVRMVLKAAGIDKAIAWRRGGHVLSHKVAARIMAHLHG